MTDYTKLGKVEVGLEVDWKDKGYLLVERFKKMAQILYDLTVENEL